MGCSTPRRGIRYHAGGSRGTSRHSDIGTACTACDADEPRRLRRHSGRSSVIPDSIPDLPPRRPGTPAVRGTSGASLHDCGRTRPLPFRGRRRRADVGPGAVRDLRGGGSAGNPSWFDGGGFRWARLASRRRSGSDWQEQPPHASSSSITHWRQNDPFQRRCTTPSLHSKGRSPLAWCLHPGRRLSWRWPGYCIDCGHGGGRQ